MKILKNRIFQIISIAVFIIAISFIVYSSTRPVLADDKVDMGLFNTKIAELQEQIDKLNTTIEEQNNEINTLKDENISLNNEIKDNSDTIKELENTINEKDKKISKINNWYNKSKELYSTFNSPVGTKTAPSDDYIKYRLIEFFEQN